jgi:hypothetical protein
MLCEHAEHLGYAEIGDIEEMIGVFGPNRVEYGSHAVLRSLGIKTTR